MKNIIGIRSNLYGIVAGLSLLALIANSATALAHNAPAFAASDGATPATSSNWAGYAAKNGSFTSVGGTWTVPAVGKTDTASAETAWVGIGGVNSNDLIQSGTQAVTDASGDVTYEAWYELLPRYPHILPVTVSANDSVSVSIARQANGQWLISFRDNTSGSSYQATVSYASSLSSAEWIVEQPSVRRGFIALDNFGSIVFSNATATMNGNVVDLADSGAQKITMVNYSKQALATPSGFDANGESFTVNRTSALATYASGSSFDSRITVRVRDFNPSHAGFQTRRWHFTPNFRR